MTARPGVAVSLLELPTPVSDQSDTGTWFAAGTSDRGPANQATLIQSIDQFNTVFGSRQSYSVLYDAVEVFFREGGNRVYIGRVVGPGATVGTKSLLDSGAGSSLVVNAVGPGAWSANYKVGVIAGITGGSFVIQVSDASNNILEQSGDLLTQGAAVAWSSYSNYVRVVLGATALNPVPVALSALSAGNDQRASVTDNEWAVALASFSAGLGPGQVSAPGRNSSVAFSQIRSCEGCGCWCDKSLLCIIRAVACDSGAYGGYRSYSTSVCSHRWIDCSQRSQPEHEHACFW
jgi:hypothetical protein